jgi:hypothetical protein
MAAQCLPAPLQIGNRVFKDLDGDGIQEPCDPPISGVVVGLYSNGVQVATQTTGPNGEYFFNVAAYSTYQLRVGLSQGPLAGLGTTRRDVAAASDLSDADGQDSLAAGFSSIPVVTGGPGRNNHNYDFGFVPLACIGDTVWFDRNRNGLQDGGAETGLAGVRVYLRDAGGRVATNTTTTAGYYQFCNLFPGDYCVEFDLTTLPIGYAPTIRGAQGSSDAGDSDANPQTGKTEFTALAPGEVDPTWDLGVVCLPPVLQCPPNRVLECPADTSVAQNGTATATSPCGCAVTISHVDQVSPSCGSTLVIQRRWTATDECGNSVACIQTITVLDTIAPVLTGVPADTQVSCDALPPVAQVTGCL